jgi:L-aspartate oxidase
VQNFDVLIIGSGLAGQSAALRLAEHCQVALVSKRTLEDSASGWAQGGIAAVLDSRDSIEAHIHDTLVAGAWLNDAAATRHVVENGRHSIEWLIEQGVPFTKDDAGYHLTREGGHSARRVIHVADATGFAVQDTLTRKVRKNPNITVLESHIAIDLITGEKLGTDENRCFGAYVLDSRNGEGAHHRRAKHPDRYRAVRARVYLYTTNPDTYNRRRYRDGLPCRVSGYQTWNSFSSTQPASITPKPNLSLFPRQCAAKAVCSVCQTAHVFMLEHDERAELAPRDIVARAIDFEMKKRGLDCVFLDISHKGEAFILNHFPNIHARCLELGIDIASEPIPVVPAAHYTCGGIVSDLQGRTDVSGLYVAGEASCTGLHGANRLASNSLLECMVFAEAVVKDILSSKPYPLPVLPIWDESRVTDADEEVVISHNWDELRRFMWDYVGIVRTNKRLKRAGHRIGLLMREINEFYANFRVSHDLIELRNLVMTADLIVRCAMQRKESRGLHYSRDYPEMLKKPKNTVLKRRRQAH